MNSTFHSQLLRLVLLLMSISASKSCYLIIYNCSLIVVISVGINHHEPVFFFLFCPMQPFFMDPIQEKKIDIKREHVITVF